MQRRQLLAGLAATAALSLVPRAAFAQSTTPEQALGALVGRFPVLSGMRITYADHVGLSLWPGKTDGIRDYRTVEMWTDYTFADYPDALYHELGHALDYWSGVARGAPARLIETAQGPIAWDSVLDDFWSVRGFGASPFASYVDEETYRRRLQAQGVQQFVGENYYYQFTPAEQFANCFAAVARGLADESALRTFHTQTWGIPLDSAALGRFFAAAGHPTPTLPAPPTSEFAPQDFLSVSSDGTGSVWRSRTDGRNVFFVNGVEVYR